MTTRTPRRIYCRGDGQSANSWRKLRPPGVEVWIIGVRANATRPVQPRPPRASEQSGPRPSPRAWPNPPKN